MDGGFELPFNGDEVTQTFRLEVTYPRSGRAAGPVPIPACRDHDIGTR